LFVCLLAGLPYAKATQPIFTKFDGKLVGYMGHGRILSLHFNGHFPGEPGLPVLIEAKDDGGGEW